MRMRNCFAFVNMKNISFVLLCAAALFAALPVFADGELPEARRAQGVEVPGADADLLVFSDHPERVERDGLLCQGGLLPLRPVRLQFYHQGGRDSALYLVLRLRNRGTSRALLTAVGGVGLGTAENYFQAGHRNNLEFLPNLLQGRGRLYELAPGESATVWSQRLEKDIVVSGTVQWRLLEGDSLEYALYSCSAEDGPFYENLLFKEKDVHARGIYPETQRRKKSTLRIGTWQSGKNAEYWAVGATRQPSAFSGPALKGDYGVLYSWDLELVNDGDAAKKMEFALNPRGGKATGTFLAQRRDGWEIWECSGELEAFQFYRLAVCEIPPHGTERMKIYTIPEGASNYPVRLVVRCLGEQLFR